jgi:hypothetical protein
LSVARCDARRQHFRAVIPAATNPEDDMSAASVSRSAIALLALAFSITPAHAIFRAYLASDGNDANPCTLQQPCRLLPAALAAVDSGGEIWMLDSANYNTATVNIAKSVSILAIPGAVGGLVATGGTDGIVINTAGVVVSLRNLVMVNLGTSGDGIDMFQGAELHVADCEFNGVGSTAIRAHASGSVVTVRNTVLRNSGNYGFGAYNGVKALLDREGREQHHHGRRLRHLRLRG